MNLLAKVLLGLSALAFVLAIVSVLIGQPILHIMPEGFSRACTNLALLAIAVAVILREKPTST